MITPKIGQKIVCADGVSTVVDMYTVYKIQEDETGYLKTTEQRYMDNRYWTLIPETATIDQIEATSRLLK